MCGACNNFEPIRGGSVSEVCRGRMGLLLGARHSGDACKNPGQFVPLDNASVSEEPAATGASSTIISTE